MSIVTREAAEQEAAAREGERPHATDLTHLAVFSTKLEPRYQRPGIIARPKVVATVTAATSPMVALIAPAGYGKSTTLAQIDGAGGRRLAWLSADQRDSDPATLIRNLAAAIHRVAPLSAETVAAVAVPGPSVWLTAVPRVGAALAAAPDITLVIDDIDRIDGDDAIDVVLALVEQVRGSARIVVAGRTFGRVPAARLVARGVLTTFGRDVLALDKTETAAVLAAAGIHLPDGEIGALADRTEGWAAGIYLSALAVGQRGRGSESISAAAPERLVEEYLRTEMLDTLDPDDAQLLVSSSVLDRLSGPLCDEVLGRRRSGAALDRLERTNLFLIPLDRRRTWFRFHHLLGDFLRAELERLDPAAAADLRQRASAWHEANGLPEAALEYAMVAGDEERAASLTVGLCQAAMNAGRTETVRRWFDWFDARSAGSRQPRLAAYAAIVFALEGDSDRAEQWADIADRTPGTNDAETPEAGVRAISRVLLARNGVARVVADAELAVRCIPEGDPWRVAALGSLGIGRQLRGDTEAAETLLTRAVARWDQGRVANTAVCLALTQLGFNALQRGDRAAAETHLKKARAVLLANGLSEQAIAVGIDALDARLAITHGAFERARSDLAHAQRLRPRLGHAMPWLAIRARLDLIRAHMALGDGGGARTLMAEVREILVLRPDMGSLLAERDELVERLAVLRGGRAGASTLTIAELRVLPLLTTHLTFREIGERLFVSQNTVKTQAISIYRKLDATSRSEAIDRAVELGLLESATLSERFIPAG